MANRVQAKEKRDTKEMVSEVRAFIEKEVAKNPELFSESDISVVLTDDWQVERFLRRKRFHVQDAAKMMTGALKWRKELGLADITDTYFPMEFYKVASIFNMGKDRQGNRMIYMRVGLHHRIKEMEYYMKQFFMYNIAKVDRETRGSGMAVVFDCKGGGYSNLDLDFLWFIVNSLISYSPLAVNYILVYDLPWILASFWGVVKSWFPEEQRNKIRFASKDQILEYIDKDNLPLYMGGTCKINYHQAPENCREARDFIEEYNITPEVVTRMEKVFQPHLEKADKEIAILTQRSESSSNEIDHKQLTTVA